MACQYVFLTLHFYRKCYFCFFLLETCLSHCGHIRAHMRGCFTFVLQCHPVLDKLKLIHHSNPYNPRHGAGNHDISFSTCSCIKASTYCVCVNVLSWHITLRLCCLHWSLPFPDGLEYANAFFLMCLCVFSVPSNSRVLMLLGQLERMNGEAMVRDVETARQVTAKIFHLIQTQGESTHAIYCTQTETIEKTKSSISLYLCDMCCISS